MLYDELSALHAQDVLDGFLLYMYAVVLRSMKLTTQALKIFTQSVRRYPLNWSAWLALSKLCTDPEKLIGLDLPEHWVTECFMGHVMTELQQHEDALARLDSLSISFPNSQYLALQRAKTYYNWLDFREAERLFQQLAAEDPYRLDGMDLYSNILFVMELRSQLSYLAHNAMKIDKYRPETCCIVGNYYSIKSQHARAVMYFHRALKLDRQYLTAWTLMGHEYVEMKQTDAAIFAYRRAVDIDPRDYRAWYGLGQAYEMLTMYKYALYYHRKAVSLRAYDARMWIALGNCYEQLKRSDEAISCYKRAHRHNDQEGIAALRLARLYRKKRRQADAVRYYEKLIESQDAEQNMGEGYAEALQFLARSYKEFGEYVKSEDYCRRLLDIGDHGQTDEAKSIMRDIRRLATSSVPGAEGNNLAVGPDASSSRGLWPMWS